MAAGLFRVVAGVCRIMIISQTGGSLTFLSMFVLGGFILPKGLISFFVPQTPLQFGGKDYLQI